MKRTLRTMIGVGILAGTAVAGSAQVANPLNLTLAKESKVWIDGTSTMKSFSCAATKVDVVAKAEPGSPGSELVQSASLAIPVASLDCRNETMNNHMRKALKADSNPRISWILTDYRVEGTSVVMNSRLTIAGKENPIQLRATGSADNAGTIRIKGSTKFRMTEYGVKPPSLMMGTMKVGDPITVSYDLVLTP